MRSSPVLAATVRISSASVSKKAFLRLDDANYRFFVNVYSGRRVFPRNILRCAYADGRLDDLQAGRRISIHCDLPTTP
jgi:hypothetical protein